MGDSSALCHLFCIFVEQHAIMATIPPSPLPNQAHFHIISSNSGLGRTAAAMSLRPNNVFQIHVGGYRSHDPNFPEGDSVREHKGSCKLRQRDDIFDTFHVWSGI